MVDMDHVGYLVKEIKKDINTPYLIHNEEVADELLPVIQKQIPGIWVIKNDIRQWFVVTTQAKRKVIKQLNQEIDEYRRKASELSKVVESLSQNKFDKCR